MSNKTAIVVGGAQGIGEATVQCLAKNGAKVVVADMNIDGANKVADEIKGGGGQAIAVKVNMTKMDEADNMAKVTMDTFGQIDILANIAGGSIVANTWGLSDHNTMVPFTESTLEDWELVLKINLTGARNCCRAVVPYMIERRYGKIVNVASTSGMIGHKENYHYAAAKAGIIALTKSLAKELAQYRINVNCISPGPFATPRVAAIPKELEQPLLERVWLGKKRAHPEEASNVIAFLASDEAFFVTGANYVVDGGLSLGYP